MRRDNRAAAPGWPVQEGRWVAGVLAVAGALRSPDQYFLICSLQLFGLGGDAC